MKKILVTGANGQLGNEIKDLAPQTNHTFIFTDIDQVDLSNESEADRYLESISPDYIINCAAYTAVDAAETDPEGAKTGNIILPRNIIAYAKERGVRVIHISTDYVFPGTGSSPLKESDEKGPSSVYGKTKLEGEKIVLSYSESIIIRTSWLYSSYGRNFVKTMVNLMKERDELRIVNDQTGSPTYARDLATAILAIVESKFQPGVYHFANEGKATWYELTVMIKEITGSACRVVPIMTKDYPLPAPRPQYSVLNTDKIKQTFALQIPDWRKSLDECLEKISDTKKS